VCVCVCVCVCVFACVSTSVRSDQGGCDVVHLYQYVYVHTSGFSVCFFGHTDMRELYSRSTLDGIDHRHVCVYVDAISPLFVLCVLCVCVCVYIAGSRNNTLRICS
jgi:hypothetical protein